MLGAAYDPRAQDQRKVSDKTATGISIHLESDNTAPGALAGVTREFITEDCARFEVTLGSEDLLLRPIDESSGSLCASFGITHLPPGATISPVEG